MLMDRYSFCNFHLKVFSGVSSHGPSSVLPSTFFEKFDILGVWLETDDSSQTISLFSFSLKTCPMANAARDT